jgi:hypothetical protein
MTYGIVSMLLWPCPPYTLLLLCCSRHPDFEEMAELVNPANIPKAQQEELEAYLREMKTDYNQRHFVRNEKFKEAAEKLSGPTRKIFVEFLERSCTAEFSGFLLFKELARRLRDVNPTVAGALLCCAVLCLQDRGWYETCAAAELVVWSCRCKDSEALGSMRSTTLSSSVRLCLWQLHASSQTRAQLSALQTAVAADAACSSAVVSCTACWQSTTAEVALKSPPAARPH